MARVNSAAENDEDWATKFFVTLHTIKTVAEQFGAGKITLPAVQSKTNERALRHAPSFIQGCGRPPRPDAAGRSGYTPERPYTADTVAKFLG